jgi:hypothetical protein
MRRVTYPSACQVHDGARIFECNPNCRCYKTCRQRLVQVVTTCYMQIVMDTWHTTYNMALIYGSRRVRVHGIRPLILILMRTALQRSSPPPLEVFQTVGKGWGVRAAAALPKGSFVCCYLGEALKPAP